MYVIDWKVYKVGKTLVESAGAVGRRSLPEIEGENGIGLAADSDSDSVIERGSGAQGIVESYTSMVIGMYKETRAKTWGWDPLLSGMKVSCYNVRGSQTHHRTRTLNFPESLHYQIKN